MSPTLIKVIAVLVMVLGMFSCEQNHVPKPKGYNRIDLPTPSYQSLDDDLPYRFEHSRHSDVEPDSFNLEEKTWVNLHYKDWDARVHITYKPVEGSRENLKAYLNDALSLTSKHQIKAYGIDEGVIKNPQGYTGLVAELSGEVPTQFQFYVTVSTHHVLRGALYFKTAVKNDSLAPIIEYIKVDMMRLINSLEFKDENGFYPPSDAQFNHR